MNILPTNQDEVIRTVNVYKTTDYKKFKDFKGNRDVNKSHARALARAMALYGNWLIDDPVEVDKDFRILDGQHSFDAAKACKQPVYYIITENQNLATIRQRNSNRRNWNWFDYATSYASEGNKHYQQMLDLAKNFKENFSVLTLYTTGSRAGKIGKAEQSPLRDFVEGNFVMPDYEKAALLLEQYHELTKIVGERSREFAFAAYRFMTNGVYNHAQMKQKLHAHRAALTNCYLETDYLYTLQDVYRA